MPYKVFIGTLDAYAHGVFNIKGHICRDYDKQECIIIPREQFGDLELVLRDPNGKELKLDTTKLKGGQR